MTRLLIPVALILGVLAFSKAQAAVCSIDAPNGVTYYRFNGAATTYISAKTTSIKPCAAEGLRVEASTGDARCLQSALAVCDPQWGGIPRLEAIAYCQGFLTAAGQYHALMHPARGPVRPLFCLPERVPTVAESGVDFAQWARATPRFADEPALDGFLRWAQARYPCPPVQAGRAMRPSR